LCVKDEGQYIKEWLEYYLMQGVNHFYIYNNNGTDNTKEIIDSYIQKGLVTWHDYPGRRQQENIYNHAVHHYKNETRWMGFIDIDEFIVPLKHPSITEFLTSFEECSQISIPWVMYGSGGHIQKPDGLVIESYKKHQKGFTPIVKSIVNPRAVVYVQVHFHLVFGLSVDEKKNLFYKVPNITSADLICCNHYFTKSYEEFCAKRKRGRAITCSPFTSDFFEHTNYNDIEDDIMDKYVDLIKKRMQQ
jgi:hypothetical protein